MVFESYRSGFVGVIGRPNVGKSTLINALVGEKIAITSSQPETTRRIIRGIATSDEGQIVLVDTPGMHKPRTVLGQRLDRLVDDSLFDVDAVMFLLPADQKIGPGDRRILTKLHSAFSHRVSQETDREKRVSVWTKPVIAVVTKIDHVSHQQLLEKLLEIEQMGHFTQIVPVSAMKHNNLDELRHVLLSVLPEGPQLYPTDMVTEDTASQRVAELIRGAFLEQLNDELPHSLAVVVDSIEYPDDEHSRANVYVSLYVERDSQKPIIIGRGASNLVRVKQMVRKDINQVIGYKTTVNLHVTVAKNWQSDTKKLQRLGF